MKLIGLATVRDEEPFLRVTAPSWLRALDEVVVLDDQSRDESAALLEGLGAVVLRAPAGFDFGQRRQFLLDAGRERGGTHFITVDADEAFDAPLTSGLRDLASALEKGQRTSLTFRTCWRGLDHYRRGGEYDLALSCLFADDGAASFTSAAIHEDRAPRSLELVSLPDHDGEMIHLQFVAWQRAQMKQAYYRCFEMVEGRPPTRINARYFGTLDGWWVRTASFGAGALDGVDAAASLVDLPPSWHRDAVLSWFDDRGPDFFEPLEIWHVPELRRAFVERVGRRPRSSWVRPVAARGLGTVYGGVRARLGRVTRRR